MIRQVRNQQQIATRLRAALVGAVGALAAMGAMPGNVALAHPEHDVPALVEKLAPAVVNISTAQEARQANVTGELEFLQRKLNRKPEASLGSGFIIDPKGLVVTNFHVIENADQITVTLNDGRDFTAIVRGRDRETDLAVLEMQADGVKFPHVKWGDVDAAPVGIDVIAIGNPFGLGGSVTKGIISARNRNISSGRYDDYIQTDASINRGNSGGPLFDMKGRVIGVNTAIYSQTGGSVGVGFAIPADLAQTVVGQLLEHGEARRGWLGVTIEDLTSDQASNFGFQRPKGAVVTVVMNGSPAANAGVRVNDVILEFNRKPITSIRDLTRAVADTPLGARAPLLILRDGKRMSLTVIVEEQRQRPFAFKDPDMFRSSGLGFKAATNEVKRAFNLANDVEGAVIVEVDPDSAAALVLKPGDVIVEIAWEKITSPDAAVSKLLKLRNLNSGPVTIGVLRGDELFYENIQPCDVNPSSGTPCR